MKTKKMTKEFVQTYVAKDCEGFHWEWVDSKLTYEQEVQDLKNGWNGWFDGVRLVEKIFDTDTFEIEIKVLKETEREYDDKGHWTGEVVETAY